jgi:hypothetical protein
LNTFFVHLRLLTGGYCDLGAVFVAAALKNDLAIFAAHAGTETVFAGATADFWLVSTLWHIISPLSLS